MWPEQNINENGALQKRQVKKLNRESCNNYITNTEYDVRGEQNVALKVMKHLRSSERDTAFTNITHDGWFNLYKDLWANEAENKLERRSNCLMTVDPTDLDELEGILKSFKKEYLGHLRILNLLVTTE